MPRSAAIAVLLLCSIAQAQSQVVTDDSDISAAPYGFVRAVPSELSPDQVEATPSEDGSTSIEVLRLMKGTLTAVSGLTISAGDGFWGGEQAVTGVWGEVWLQNCPAGESVRASASLEDSHFSITSGRRTYRISATVACGNHVRLIFNEDSDGGQALGIWQVAYRAKAQLAEAVGLDFWRSTIPFSWPADADYYSWGTVHISRGDHWDVVGHEMGHAIYDQADIGAFGGGQHFIDRCYSGNLALSEGWASYFSAWVSVPLDDADARFEYMVPRRAPIRFENIPEDVCEGPNNEWRVNGFFWDFIDLADDGEGGTETFARVWQALLNGNARNVGAAAQSLVSAGFDPALVDTVWNLNFRTAR